MTHMNIQDTYHTIAHEFRDKILEKYSGKVDKNYPIRIGGSWRSQR